MAIKLDYSNVMDILKDEEINGAADLYRKARQTVIDRNGAGSDFLGWLNLPDTIPDELVDDIVKTAQRIRQDTDLFISIGIGGSYLGARASTEALLPEFVEMRQPPRVVFAGHSISARYLEELLELMKGKKVTVNVISKSGTTTEPAIAFRAIRRRMVEQYGRQEANSRIIATTDAKSGAPAQNWLTRKGSKLT